MSFFNNYGDENFVRNLHELMANMARHKDPNSKIEIAGDLINLLEGVRDNLIENNAPHDYINEVDKQIMYTRKLLNNIRQQERQEIEAWGGNYDNVMRDYNDYKRLFAETVNSPRK